jgi:hypothetical protein
MCSARIVAAVELAPQARGFWHMPKARVKGGGSACSIFLMESSVRTFLGEKAFWGFALFHMPF